MQKRVLFFLENLPDFALDEFSDEYRGLVLQALLFGFSTEGDEFERDVVHLPGCRNFLAFSAENSVVEKKLLVFFLLVFKLTQRKFFQKIFGRNKKRS